MSKIVTNLKTWINSMSAELKTINLNGINVITPEMWNESIYKWGLREAIYEVDELNDIWDAWKLTHMNAWSRIYKALTVEYSPIENVDRHEDITDTTTHTGTDNRTLASTHGKSGTDTLARTGTSTLVNDTTSTLTGSDDNTHKINAFNGDEPTTDNTDSSTSKASNTGKLTETNTKDLTDTTTYNSQDSEKTSDERVVNLTDKMVHTNHTHGNIGVTENTTMISHEIQLRQSHYMYKEIVEPFILYFFF